MFTGIVSLVIMYCVVLFFIGCISKALAGALFVITVWLGMFALFGLWAFPILIALIITLVVWAYIEKKHNEQYYIPRDDFEKELIEKLRHEELIKKAYDERASNQCNTLYGEDEKIYNQTKYRIKKFKEELNQHREENNKKNNVD